VTAPSARAYRVLDAAVALWVAGCIALATLVALDVADLTELSDSVVAAGRGLDETAKTLRQLEEVPFVGGEVSALADRASEAAASATESGRSSRAAIDELALLLGIAIALVPTVPVVVLYALLRRAWRGTRLPEQPATGRRDA
jgi:hypothetical protein